MTPQGTGGRTGEYRGYHGRYEFDAEDAVLHGRVEGIRYVVTFVAPTLPELERELRISVDVYLSYCLERGLTPGIPAR